LKKKKKKKEATPSNAKKPGYIIFYLTRVRSGGGREIEGRETETKFIERRHHRSFF
jgi:hypothetical protein